MGAMPFENRIALVKTSLLIPATNLAQRLPYVSDAGDIGPRGCRRHCFRDAERRSPKMRSANFSRPMSILEAQGK
jgi:hypothetical protein